MLVLGLKFKPNKKTCDVTLSDGQILNLTSESLVKFGIYQNAEITENALTQALAESDKAKALDQAINYLTKGYRSEKQLRDYLREKKYSPVIQSYVIEKLKSYNYLNDEYLANAFVQSAQTKMGINKIKQKLYEKGIPKKMIETATNDIQSQDDICLEIAQKKWASIIKSKPQELNSQELYKFNQSSKAKLVRYLTSQGFDWDTISRTLSVLGKSNEE